MTNKQILKSKKITHCYIRKNGSYYMPNACGYTEFKHMAGVYTKEDAVDSADKCKELYLVPIDNVAHNKMIMDKVQEIATRYI